MQLVTDRVIITRSVTSCIQSPLYRSVRLFPLCLLNKFFKNAFVAFFNGHVKKSLGEVQSSIIRNELTTLLSDQNNKCRVWYGFSSRLTERYPSHCRTYISTVVYLYGQTFLVSWSAKSVRRLRFLRFDVFLGKSKNVTYNVFITIVQSAVLRPSVCDVGGS